MNADDIRRLRAQSRLKDEDHPMGVMPGEAAAFVLVAPAGLYPQPLSRILGLGVATDEGVPPRASGLQEAIERALRDAGVHEAEVAFTVTDNTGERARAIDYMIAEMRTFRTTRASMPHWTFSEAAGDTGAAAGAIAVVLASMAHAKGYSPGPLAVCAASSDAGTHAACVIAAA